MKREKKFDGWVGLALFLRGGKVDIATSNTETLAKECHRIQDWMYQGSVSSSCFPLRIAATGKREKKSWKSGTANGREYGQAFTFFLYSLHSTVRMFFITKKVEFCPFGPR